MVVQTGCRFGNQATSSSSASVLLRGLFTARLTLYASMDGGEIASSIAMASSGLAAIHSSIWPAYNQTGMRSWMSAETPLLSPVMIVKVPRFPSGSKGLVSSHRPAANSGWTAWMNHGSFLPSSGLTRKSRPSG